MFTAQDYFDENAVWSLLSYLKHREHSEDFSADKGTEHRNYQKDLEHILLNEKSEDYREQAANFLYIFQNKKPSERVDTFWAEIKHKEQMIKVKRDLKEHYWKKEKRLLKGFVEKPQYIDDFAF